MAKTKEQALTVRLGEELDVFLEKYAARRGQSKSGVLVQLAFDLYERERERELEQQWKQAQILESRIKLKNLSHHGSQQVTRAQSRDMQETLVCAETVSHQVAQTRNNAQRPDDAARRHMATSSKKTVEKCVWLFFGGQIVIANQIMIGSIQPHLLHDSSGFIPAAVSLNSREFLSAKICFSLDKRVPDDSCVTHDNDTWH